MTRIANSASAVVLPEFAPALPWMRTLPARDERRRYAAPQRTGLVWRDRVATLAVVVDEANVCGHNVHGEALLRGTALPRYFARLAEKTYVHVFSARRDAPRRATSSPAGSGVTWVVHHMEPRQFGTNVDHFIALFIAAELGVRPPNAVILMTGDGGFAICGVFLKSLPRPVRVGCLAHAGKLSPRLAQVASPYVALIGRDLLDTTARWR